MNKRVYKVKLSIINHLFLFLSFLLNKISEKFYHETTLNILQNLKLNVQILFCLHFFRGQEDLVNKSHSLIS